MHVIQSDSQMGGNVKYISLILHHWDCGEDACTNAIRTLNILIHTIAKSLCDRLQENRAQRGTLRNFFWHLQSCRRPDIELTKFYRRSLSRSRYNKPNRSLPSA